MKKVFIAYADEKMVYSLKRIGRQARSLGIFDDIILWTPKELPQYIKNSPLMQYTYGGGYWAWKPGIIYETLQRYEEGTVVCYVDAGCTLRKGIEWTLWFELMRDYDTILFRYKDEMPEWKKFGTIHTNIKYWTKKNLLLFLDQQCGATDYRENNKILGGVLFFKGKNNTLLQEWKKIMLYHPEVILDPSKEELQDQYPYFALHKHDQSVLTALAYKHKSTTIVLPELSETCGKHVAIYASRIRARNLKEYLIIQIKAFIRFALGDIIINKLKRKG